MAVMTTSPGPQMFFSFVVVDVGVVVVFVRVLFECTGVSFAPPVVFVLGSVVFSRMVVVVFLLTLIVELLAFPLLSALHNPKLTLELNGFGRFLTKSPWGLISLSKSKTGFKLPST